MLLTCRLTLAPLPKKILAARLRSGGTAEVKQTDDGISIAVPLGARQDLDTIVEFSLDGSAMSIEPAAE